MGITFNADEIFAMAQRIEKNGAHYYRAAAEKFSDEHIKTLLGTLAEMEDQHLRIFSIMREDLTAKEKEAVVFDPDGQVREYLAAMADGYVFNVHDDPISYLKVDETPQDVLKRALGFEKDSIVFYLGIRDMVPEKLGRERVEGIIKEEMNHIVILNKELAALK